MVEDHRHCHICGKVVPAHLVSPGENPVLCSLACRREYERRQGEFKRLWRAYYFMVAAIVGMMLLWPVIAAVLAP